MPFSPSTSELYTIDDNLFEMQEFSVSISYTGDLITYPTATWSVSITPQETFPHVNVTNNSISGYYSGVFSGFSVKYLTDNLEYKTVYSWADVVDAKEIISYSPPTSQSKTLTYTAVATRYDVPGQPGVVEETIPYTIVVCNNWTTGQTLLKAAVKATIDRRK